MSDNIGYQSPAVYLPQASVLLQQPMRERLEGIDPPQKLDVEKAADLPQGLRVQEPAASEQNFSDSNFSADRDPKDQLPSPGNKVLAQETASDVDDGPITSELRKVSAVPGPAEVVGTPEALSRLDQDSDGHIDQLEVKHAIRADADSTTYAALSQYRKALDLNANQNKEMIEPQKLFDDSGEGEKLFDDVEANIKLFDETVEEENLFDAEELEKKLYEEEEAENKLFDEGDEDALRHKIYGEEVTEESEVVDGATKVIV